MGRRRAHPLFRNEDGQAMVELAFVLPIMVLLVFGALEVGRVFNAWIIVTQASREGARVAAAQCTIVPTCDTDVDNRIIGSLSGLNSTVARYTVTNGPYTPGNPVTVRVEYDVPLVTPLISAFFPGNPFTVSGETTMRLE